MRTGTVTEDGITLRIAAPARTLNELVGNMVIVFFLGVPAMIALVVLEGRITARQALEACRRGKRRRNAMKRKVDRQVKVSK